MCQSYAPKPPQEPTELETGGLQLKYPFFFHGQSLDVFFHLLLLLSDKKQYALVTTGWQRYKLNSEWEKEIVCFTGEPRQVCAQRLRKLITGRFVKGEVK